MISELIPDGRAEEAEVADLRRELDRLHRYIRQEWSRAGRQEAEPGTLAQQVAEGRLAEADRRLLESTAMATRHVDEAQARADQLLETAKARADAVLADAERVLAEAETQAAQRLAAADSMAEQALARVWQEAARSRDRADEAARSAVASIQQRYQDIIVRAHQRAEQAAANALHELEHHAGNADDPGQARAQLQLRASYLTSAAEVSRTAMRAALTYATREFDRLLNVSG